MVTMLDRLKIIYNAERLVGYTLQVMIAQNNGQPNAEILTLLDRLRVLNEQYAPLSLRIIHQYAYLSPAQRTRVNTLRRNEIVRLRLWGTFMAVARQYSR